MRPASTQSDRPRQRGAALLLCMLFTAAAISMLLVLSTRTVAHTRQAEYATFTAAAFSAAEAAQALAIADLQRGGGGNLGGTGEVTWDETGRPILPAFGDRGADPIPFAGPPDGTWFTATATRPDLPADCVVLYSFAQSGPVERRLEAVLRRAAPGVVERVTWRELSPHQIKEAAHAVVPLLGD